MSHWNKFLRLGLCLTVFSAIPALPQFNQESVAAIASTPSVAHVYVQTTRGVNAYNAATNGHLTLIPGSPFKTTGEMIGGNGKYFITLGTNWIHVYPVESNGALGKQVATTNTQNFGGADCGPTSDASLDHTGQNLFVALEYGTCDAYQSYSIAKNGQLTFEGVDILVNSDPSAPLNFYYPMPSVTANEKFAYISVNGWPDFTSSAPGQLTGFRRLSNGVLQETSFLETDPTPWPKYDYEWILNSVNSDPTNHLAVSLYGRDGNIKYQQNQMAQLASYTEDAKGNLVSTNTYANMPIPLVAPMTIQLSPSGKLLAVGGDETYESDFGTQSAGLQVFHFNGSAPITAFSSILTTASFGTSSLRWDKSNHLYAFGTVYGSPTVTKLYVFTVTPNSINMAPGSPYTFPDYLGFLQNPLVVVSE